MNRTGHLNNGNQASGKLSQFSKTATVSAVSVMLMGGMILPSNAYADMQNIIEHVEMQAAGHDVDVQDVIAEVLADNADKFEGLDDTEYQALLDELVSQRIAELEAQKAAEAEAAAQAKAEAAAQAQAEAEAAAQAQAQAEAAAQAQAEAEAAAQAQAEAETAVPTQVEVKAAVPTQVEVKVAAQGSAEGNTQNAEGGDTGNTRTALAVQQNNPETDDTEVPAANGTGTPEGNPAGGQDNTEQEESETIVDVDDEGTEHVLITTPEAPTVDEIASIIDALPSPSSVSKDDAEAIEAAWRQVNALDEETRVSLGLDRLDKLASCHDAINAPAKESVKDTDDKKTAAGKNDKADSVKEQTSKEETREAVQETSKDTQSDSSSASDSEIVQDSTDDFHYSPISTGYQSGYSFENGVYTGPIRAQKNLSTEMFIASIGQSAQVIAEEHSLYASVMIAQAIIESDSGNSGLSKAPNNNLFGVKGQYEGSSVSMATQEDNGAGNLYDIIAGFRKYPSILESMTDYAELLRQDAGHYSKAWKENAPTYREAAKALQGTYATSTVYAETLCAVIEAYDLTRYDETPSFKLTEKIEETKDGKKTVRDATMSDYIGLQCLADAQLGIPYVWGGTTQDGFDCSGLVQWLYREAFGISLPRTTYTQQYCGTEVPFDELRMGDLLFFDGEQGDGGPEHVAMYMGDGFYIHAPEPGDVVKIGDMQSFKPSYAKRILSMEDTGEKNTPKKVEATEEPATDDRASDEPVSEAVNQEQFAVLRDKAAKAERDQIIDGLEKVLTREPVEVRAALTVQASSTQGVFKAIASLLGFQV